MHNIISVKLKRMFSLVMISICLISYISLPAQHAHLRVGVFETDVTPPIGSPVAYAITRSIVDPLSARGMVIFIDDQKPVVLCAVDWIGISNEGHEVWEKKLAEAARQELLKLALESDMFGGAFTGARVISPIDLVSQVHGSWIAIGILQSRVRSVSRKIIKVSLAYHSENIIRSKHPARLINANVSSDKIHSNVGYSLRRGPRNDRHHGARTGEGNTPAAGKDSIGFS